MELATGNKELLRKWEGYGLGAFLTRLKQWVDSTDGGATLSFREMGTDVLEYRIGQGNREVHLRITSGGLILRNEWLRFSIRDVERSVPGLRGKSGLLLPMAVGALLFGTTILRDKKRLRFLMTRERELKWRDFRYLKSEAKGLTSPWEKEHREVHKPMIGSRDALAYLEWWGLHSPSPSKDG